MLSLRSRAGRSPLALIATFALALGACADEPSAPNARPTRDLPATRALVGAGDSTVVVTNTSGGTDVGSLRWAATQLPPSGGVIRFAPSLAGATITLSGWVDLSYPAFIDGPADKGITISGAGAPGIIGASMGVGLRNVTLTKGTGTPHSAITSWAGPVYLENSTVTEQSALYAAIFTTGNFYLVNSTISGINAISAVELGGASIAFVTNSTITNVRGSVFGKRFGPDTPPTVFVKNSILSINSGFQICQSGVGPTNFTYDGMNIVSDASCGTSSHAFVANPRLLPLADNGGPTKTHALDYQSPGVNGGSDCTVAVDQRWTPRDAICDVGAFEFTDFTIVTITVNPNASLDPATGSALVTGTVACTRNEPELGLRVRVAQDQKTGRTTTVVSGEGGTGVGGCTTTPKAWSAPVAPSSGTFQTGAAVITASTNDIATWIKPASVDQAVKLSRAK